MKKIFKTKEEIIDFWSSYSENQIKLKRIQEYYTSKLTYNKIVSVTDLSKEALILDVGCGWGRITRQFLMDGYRNIIGIELTFDLLSTFIKDGYSLTSINADACNLPFRSKTFNLVYATRVLQYVDDVEAVIKEFLRVLKLGGELVIIQPNGRNPYRMLNYHTRFVPIDKLLNALKNFGFDDILTRYFGFSPPKWPIPFLEYFGEVPFLRVLGGFYLIKGKLPIQNFQCLK